VLLQNEALKQKEMSGKRTGNPLLAKPQLGKPTPRFFTLPSDDFTYGRTSIGKDGGAAEGKNSRFLFSGFSCDCSGA
jgi:hypothetical protein